MYGRYPYAFLKPRIPTITNKKESDLMYPPHSFLIPKKRTDIYQGVFANFRLEIYLFSLKYPNWDKSLAID
jgi:hypothetical protein